MKPFVLKKVGVYLAAVIGLFASPVHPATDSLVAFMEVYFSALKEDFDQRTTSSLVKTARAAQLGGYFAGIMKKNPSLASIMKVDAQGRVICERVRNIKQPVKKRSVAQRSWFVKTAKGLKEFDCLVTDKNGRTLIYWSVPLVRDGVPAAKRFNGAVIGVVDLKDCFQAIARAGAQPFLVRLNNKNFYEHAWKSKIIFVEYPLSIPGVENLIVRYQKSDVSMVPQTDTPPKSGPASLALPAAASVSKASQDSFQANPQVPPISAAKKNMPFIVSLIVLIIVVSVLLIIQIADRINRRRTSRLKDNNDPL